MDKTICPICGKHSNGNYIIVDEIDKNGYKTVNCSKCGNFQLNEDVIQTYNYIFYYKLACWIREQNDYFGNSPKINKEMIENLLNIKDKKIKEKFDLMMNYLNLLNDSRWLDENILVKCWMKNTNDLDLLIKKAIKDNLIEAQEGKLVTREYQYPSFKNLTFDGLEYVENLKNPNQSSKNIFVAFNFEDDLNEVFNVHLNKAITENGFNYVVVNQDNVEHNKSINDEIIVKLKSSRIVIADFTNHRNSVYFEAGFAMGMNIPIIWTCQDGHDKEMSFDTRQFPHIIWKNKDDLVKQVIDRIKVIL